MCVSFTLPINCDGCDRRISLPGPKKSSSDCDVRSVVEDEADGVLEAQEDEEDIGMREDALWPCDRLRGLLAQKGQMRNSNFDCHQPRSYTSDDMPCRYHLTSKPASDM
jgi:hypothetical protein